LLSVVNQSCRDTQELLFRKKLGLKPGLRVQLTEARRKCASGIEGRTHSLRNRKRRKTSARFRDVLHQSRKPRWPRSLSEYKATRACRNLLGKLAKKSSGVATDLDENIVRDIGLAAASSM